MKRLQLFLIAACLATPVYAEEKLSPEVRKALEETEAKIRALKAAGQLPEASGPVAQAGIKKPPEGCTRLPVGAAAIVHFPTDDQSPTGTSAAYGLSRHSEKQFLAEVRLRFVKGPGNPTTDEPKVLDEKYRKKIGDCLKTFEGKLKGALGRELTVRLTDNPSVPEQVIQVMPDGFRSHRFQYEADISCPVALHEVLHLLGLSDEYPHRPGLTEVHLDCRPAAPEDSIMGDHRQAIAVASPRPVYEIQFCLCELKGTACWELAAKSDGKACPKGSTMVWEKVDPTIRTSLNVLNTNERFVLDLGKVRESGFQAPVKDSILYPAHVRAITEPGCRDVNEAYYACSQNAYRFSKATAGVDLGDPALGCKPTPEACRWRSFKWLD